MDIKTLEKSLKRVFLHDGYQCLDTTITMIIVASESKSKREFQQGLRRQNIDSIEFSKTVSDFYEMIIVSFNRPKREREVFTLFSGLLGERRSSESYYLWGDIEDALKQLIESS